MNVILIGMKHCGKSTLGAALAARWNCPFYDVDRMIEDLHKIETGQMLGVREIFAIGGEERFHELEAKVVCDLFLRLGEMLPSSVVSVGGRTALNTKVDALLGAMGLVVYLEVPAEELYARVLRSGLPPFVDEKDPLKHFLELHEARAPQYRKLAKLTVDLDKLDATAALAKLSRSIEDYAREHSRAK